MRCSSPKAEPQAPSRPEPPPAGIWRRARPWLGTVVCLEAEGERAAALAAIEDAFAAVAEIHRLMSAHDSDSELSRLSRLEPGRPQQVSPLLSRVLRAALALARASGGIFDPTVGGAMARRGLLPAAAASDAGEPADETAGEGDDEGADWRDVVLLGGSRVMLRRRLRLDLGGIAKGFAVDRALMKLRRPGIVAAKVNAGGDLRSFGRLHQVWVRDPAAPGAALPAVEISDAAVATSGGYFVSPDEPPGETRRETGLLDPRSGASLARDGSATVCARRAVWADGLTKVVLADPDAAAPLLRRCGASALLLGNGGARRWIG